MRIIYPYNEILPKKKAHDVFIVQQCAALAERSIETTLLIGNGSDTQELHNHYNIAPSDQLHIKTLFIVRKNNPLGISWNWPFFYGCQKKIEGELPDFVLLSVRKQGAYHLKRKIANVRYLYEVHELCYYPNKTFCTNHDFEMEKKLLQRADVITVTTTALKQILLAKPYQIQVPIVVVPLAVNAARLAPPPPASPLMLLYVGQLYAGQGLPVLLRAMQGLKGVSLKILGGTRDEIFQLSKLAKELQLSDSVEFLGFVAPSKIPFYAQDAHAFVAPFENVGRMPFVAHTKLYEYAEWGRPIIAPRLAVVEEHFQDGKGALFFESGKAESLKNCIVALMQDSLRTKLQEEILAYGGTFSWKIRAQKYEELLKS